MAKDNHFLAKFELAIGTTSQSQNIKITLDLDANGILTVTAVDLSTGSKNGIVIANDTGRLSADEIRRMVDEAVLNKEIDSMHRQVIGGEDVLGTHCEENENIFSAWKKISLFLVSKLTIWSELKVFLKASLSVSKKLMHFIGLIILQSNNFLIFKD